MSLPKILCLHGFGQNASIMSKKTQQIRELLSDRVEFVYLSAPFKLPETHQFAIDFNNYIKQNESKNQSKNIEPPLSWFPSNDNKVVDYMPVFPHIIKTLKEKGPFIGIIGFSQGAALTTYLTKLLEINHPYIKEANHPALQFSIMFSGFIPHMKEVMELFETKVNTPSLHLFSNSDKVVKYDFGIENSNTYNNPIVVEHKFGHNIPSTGDYIQLIVHFIITKLNQNTKISSSSNNIQLHSNL
ncbi:hypothetical protein CONCODRAFT_84566 [Conidiobolus coronatus NRRL 28638]|uniref:Serine hydrolase domain-containing protein n=1 Tax=Conidiobolus coronatus (strain ATCC 28846 / CBS 209.66 / NRRL 28638) TaxID=796925 RepID=A0A137P9I7_CONC2|nr:hypothetical protein CONCODRAFT_84566 [Conidiobolus coronatus NRRL 28638]|eukprot:KXN71659.1 hypothetical protein CONCODRAFT_84566 [Conidiobolus coronatus NRRL 28638]